MPENYRATHAADMRRYPGTGETAILRKWLELEGLKKDGSILQIEIRIEETRELEGRRLFTAAVRDAANKMDDKKTSQNKEEKQFALYEKSGNAVYITWKEGKFIDAGKSTLKLFWYTKEEIIDQDATKVFANPEDRNKFKKEMERKESILDCKVEFVRKDGNKLNCLLTSTVWKGPDATVLGYRGIIHDVNPNKG